MMVLMCHKDCVHFRKKLQKYVLGKYISALFVTFIPARTSLPPPFPRKTPNKQTNKTKQIKITQERYLLVIINLPPDILF